MNVDARELRVPGSGMTAGTDERKEGAVIQASKKSKL